MALYHFYYMLFWIHWVTQNYCVMAGKRFRIPVTDGPPSQKPSNVVLWWFRIFSLGTLFDNYQSCRLFETCSSCDVIAMFIDTDWYLNVVHTGISFSIMQLSSPKHCILPMSGMFPVASRDTSEIIRHPFDSLMKFISISWCESFV